jgi:trk system potassium uptake protein TrkH
MKVRIFLRFFSSLIKLLGIFLLIPGLVSAYYGETQSVLAFALASLLTLITGMILGLFGSDEEMGHKEGLALVAFGWLGAALFGALPYFFLGTSFIDGLFESMSGFTTTGSSILTEMNAQGYWIINQTLANQSLAATLEWRVSSYAGNAALFHPQHIQTYFGLLFWRSFSQWLGGMGIILLFIAILPRLGVAGRQLYRAEVPGLDKESFKPHIQQTARVLWWIYLLLTVAEIFLLVVAGMPLYDSLCNAFATMATGGLSPQGLSIMAYHSGYIDAIITVFMFLAGANFVLHYKTLHSDRKSLIRDPEFRLYALIILVSTAILATWGGLNQDPLTTAQIGQDTFEKIRIASFQVVSIMTTTGFATADFDKWTAVAKYLLLLLMFIGACAGSTGGAIKVVRILLVMKSAYREFFYALHPKAVLTVKLGGIPIKEEILRPSNVFVALYIFIFAFLSLLLGIICGHDPHMDVLTITSAVATTLGNVGPGFGVVGPNFSFAEIPAMGKILLFFSMWIGRLEIITALILLVPEFWKK